MAKTKPDTFLADDLGRNRPRPMITLADGLRFGIGSTIGFLLVAVVLGGVTWALITLIGH